jgi:DNA-binding cell septation regulator SpoVG
MDLRRNGHPFLRVIQSSQVNSGKYFVSVWTLYFDFVDIRLIGGIKLDYGLSLFLQVSKRANLRLNAKQRDGTLWDIAYPANAKTRRMIQQAMLAEYEKVVIGGDPVPSENHKANAR